VTNADCVAPATCFEGVCDYDPDGDDDPALQDNCPNDANPLQTDTDQDGLGDVCDNDDDNDGILDTIDNCPLFANPNQEDQNNRMRSATSILPSMTLRRQSLAPEVFHGTAYEASIDANRV
jgi:hypothetical protein